MKQLFRIFCLSLLIMVTGMVSAKDTYTVAGVTDIVNGTIAWDQNNTANEMTSVGNNYYKLVVQKRLEAGNYQYKIVKNHDWNYGSWPSSNAILNVTQSGTYTIIFSFNSDTKAISAIATASVAGSATGSNDGGVSDNLFGNSWDQTSNDMTLQSDGTFKWSKKNVVLNQGNMTYKIVANHNWDQGSWPSSNATLNIPADGTYNCVFTFDPVTKAVNATATQCVAKVGDEYYETLQEAFNAATEGQTVTLLSDYNATNESMAGGNRQFVIKKSITFDGNGYTLTTKERGIGIGNVNNNLSSMIDVTIKNISINNTSSGARCIDTRGKINSLTLENVTLSTNGATGYTQPLTIGGNQSTAATVNITNSTIKTDDNATAYYAIITFNPVNMNISSSTIMGWACIYAKAPDGSAGSAGSVFNIDQSTLISSNAYSGISNSFSAFMMEDNNVTINVTNTDITITNTGDQIQAIAGYPKDSSLSGAVTLGEGNNVTFQEPGNYKLYFNKSNNATFTITGGTFNFAIPDELLPEGYICTANSNGTYIVVEGSYVAEINGTKYVTLADAVAAVPTDGTETTITMIGNETMVSNAGVTIPDGKNVVLDLNGKTVKGVFENPTSAQTILNKGTLTITDNSNEKNGTITNEVSDENAGSPMAKNWYSNVITNNGTLTVNAGNIVNVGTGGACYAIDNITNGTTCTPVLNIAGGNITAKKVAVRMFCNSTTNVNTVNVTDGYISSELAYALQTQQANKSANKAALNISGGTFSGQSAWCDYGDKNTVTQFDNTTYSITGGFFSGYMFSYATYYCGMEGFISGGYFDNVVGSDMVVPGKACVDNTDEATKENYPYTIGLADVYYYWLDNNGNIDGGGYYTIYAPFEGPEPVLMDGEFIELQKDITLTKDIEYLEECDFGDPIFKGGTFTLTFGEYDIDLNGFKFPIPTGVIILTDKQTDIFSAAEEGYEIVGTEIQGGYSYTAKFFVAQIGNVKYESLKDAVDAAQDNDVIVLIANDNVSLTAAGSEITITKPLTITGAVDENGKPKFTIFGSANGALNNSSFNDLFLSCSTGTVTVSNVKFDGFGNEISSVMGHSPVFIGSSNQNAIIENVYISNLNCEGIHINGGTFTIKDCNIDCSKTTNSIFTKGICVVNDAEGSIENTTITGVDCDDSDDTSAAIELQGSGDIAISGCTIQSNTIGIATTPVEELTAGTSQVTISDCMVESHNIAVYSNGEKGALTSITSGYYSGLLMAGDNDEGLSISGGVFNDMPEQAYCAEGYAPAGNPDATTNETYPYTVLELPDVAKIGDVKFKSLADAVAAVPSDGEETTITMIANETINVNIGTTVAANQNIILDLNGFTVSQYAPSASTSCLIRNNGTLTIKDSSDTNKDGAGTGKLYSEAANPSSNYNYATNLISNYGQLTIESGYLESNTAYASYVIDNYPNGNAVVNGGHLYNIRTSAIRLFCNSTTAEDNVTINGGLIEGYCTIWAQSPNNNANKGSLTIKGGTLKTTEKAVVNGEKTIAQGKSYLYMYPTTSNMSLTITGGEFDTNIATWGDGNISISGGTFNGWIYTDTQKGFITGGYFIDQEEAELDEEYVAEGLFIIPATNKPGYNTVGTPPASSLIVFHDSGTYEKAFEVPMYTRVAGATIYYKVGDGAAQQYSGPVNISDDTQLEAWIQIGDTKIGESVTRTYTIVTPTAGPSVEDGYYYIKNEGNSKYVNVAGRKTVTFMSKTDAEQAAGAVIRVKAAEGGAVETLRSQAIDLPDYARRAMNYVPDMVQLVANKLDPNGTLLGEHGFTAIMTKFNESFDYNLYLEKVGEDADSKTYRIYGRTPSMKPVVDFYAENKANVDAKLPQLEGCINTAIEKVRDRLGVSENSLPNFSIITVWEKMGSTLTKPVDAESTARFYEEVLASESNVWSFAYETAMMYYEPLLDKIDNGGSGSYQEIIAQLGDYAKYLQKLPQVHPNFKYYIVAKDGKIDFISEGNPDIDTDVAVWTLENRIGFTVAFEADNKLVDGAGTKYYTTLYTDFAYTMPKDGKTKAYAVTGVVDVNERGFAKLTEIADVIPAQTPVLLMTQPQEGQQEVIATVDLSTLTGTVPEKNLLKGNDWIVDSLGLETAQLKVVFKQIEETFPSLYNNYLAQYKYLLKMNAGTVNNKYFFGLKEEDLDNVAFLRQLGKDKEIVSGPMELGFWDNTSSLPANKAFLIETHDPVLLPLWPDINRDGKINNSDITALVDITLYNDAETRFPYYDFVAADVNGDGIINLNDITALVDIVLYIKE